MRNLAPRRPQLRLSVGVTGHREQALRPEWRSSLEERIDFALAVLERETAALQTRAPAIFLQGPPAFTLVSPLASGADQIVAGRALARGWSLQAIIPMPRQRIAEAEPESAPELDRLLASSECVLELPGDPAHALDAFVMAGRATVAHCDLLIAIWDGLPARGRGGTGETVDRALVRGTPILHLPVDPKQESVLFWSAFDPVVITAPGDRQCGRDASVANIRLVLDALLMPPLRLIERSFIDRFLSERVHSLRLRPEYPLLLMLAGVRRFSRSDVSARPQIDRVREEWQRYRDRCSGCLGVDAKLDELERAYETSDRLATHFAQVYRSSHILNFVLAALGACIGLSGLVLNVNPLWLALAEFAVVLVIIINTLAGARRCWHQRWLDYRQLAERLRPMRSLKLIGIAAPDPPGNAAAPIARRWIDWYAASLWRTIGCPAGAMTATGSAALASALADEEIAPQVRYNDHNAQQVETLDRRLEILGLTLFIATLVVTLGVIAGLVFRPQWIGALGNWTTVLSAGLPALGTAVFGIRVQGDYGSIAARSRTTARALERIATELQHSPGLQRTADLAEQAARVMLADLGEWRLVSELHELSLG